MLNRYGNINVSMMFDILLIIVISNENCGNKMVISMVKIINVDFSE